MQVLVSCSDSLLPDVPFNATVKSLVNDVLQEAATEWSVDTDFLELFFEGTRLQAASRLMSHGVVAESVLVVSMISVFSKEWFIDKDKRSKITRNIQSHTNLCLDTNTFTENDQLVFDDLHILKTVVSISFTNSNSTTAIGLNFLRNWESLSSVDMSLLDSITSVGNYFLCNCSSLKTLNFPCLSNIKFVGTSFLCDVSSITALDLSALCNITTIHNNFLSGCDSLTSLNLSFDNVSSIDHDFLSRCKSLTSLDLSSFSSVRTIGNNFLCECKSLLSLDLTNLTGIDLVGSSFMDGCTSLVEDNSPGYVLIKSQSQLEELKVMLSEF